MPKIAGIDLGSHTVKLAILDGSFGRFEFVEYRVRAVPQDIDQAPDLTRKLAALGALLDDMEDEEPIFGTTVAAYPTEQTSVRLVKLPFGDIKQVIKTLPFEVESQVPFDMDDMVLTSRIIQVSETGSTAATALARKQDVRSFLEGLNEWDVDPRNLVVDAEALGRLGPDQGTAAILDMGHTHTIVSLVSNGKVVGARAVPGGGRHLTVALCNELGISWDEAEGRKHNTDISQSDETIAAEVRWDEDEVTQNVLPAAIDAPDSGFEASSPTRPVSDEARVLREALGPMLVEVRATLIALEDLHGLQIDEIVLSGGTAALGGLRGWMQVAYGVPVRLVGASEAAQQMGTPTRFAMVDQLGEIAASTRAGRLLDFRKDDFTYKGDLTAFRNLLAYAVVAAIAFSVVGLGMFAYRYHKLNQNLELLDAELAAAVVETFPDVSANVADQPSMALSIAQEQATEMTNRVDALKSIYSEEPPVLSMLQEVSDALPPHTEARIDVTEMTIGTNRLTFKAETDSFNTATQIENTLKEEKDFANARKGDEKKCRDSICFSMTIPLGNDEEEG